jgi:S1-C subfamily serine protease
MDGEGPDHGRDAPDDHDGHDEVPLRGWIPPDDRLWRHPSEMAAISGADEAGATRGRRERTTVLAVGAAGAAAVVLTMAAAFAMTGPGTSGTTTSLAVTMTSLTTTSAATSGATAPQPLGADAAAMIAALRPSLVGVQAVATPGTASSASPTLTGVVLPGGRLVATAASAVVGMHAVDVVTADGRRHRGTVAGADGRSGVAVVTLDDALPAAAFADDEAARGTSVLAACLCGRGAGAGTPSVASGQVEANGEPAELSDGTNLVDVLEVSAPLSPGAWGAVLVDDHGRVAGLLDGEGQAAGKAMGLFVPAPLAVAVADALAKGGLDHGWLGIVCTDHDNGVVAGPVISSVFAGGPADVAGIHPGDVVTAVDGHQVVTVAQLQARLYALGPGAGVVLALQRASGTATVTMALTAEPT